MKTHTFTCEQRLDAPLNNVFDFFSDAHNLEAITPPFLRFEVVTPRPIAMQIGTLIDYRLRVRGLPIRWRSEITAWDPPHRFIDEQRRGPYRLWHHEHRFEADGDATMAYDEVTYAVPLNWLLHGFIRKDIERIFAYRQEQLEAWFNR